MDNKTIKQIKKLLSDYEKKEEMSNEDNINYLSDAIQLLNEVITK